MKKISIAALVAGLLLLVLSMPVVDWLQMDDYHRNTIERLETAMLSLGCVTAFWGLLGWIFNKKAANWCNLKTSLIALGLAVMVSMGIWSGLSILGCFVLDGDPAQYPIRFPASGLLGCLCLAGFVGLFCLYCKVRTKKHSVPGVILEVVMSLSYCVPLLILWAVVDTILSRLI
ncbi:MAG: hypothetical protein E7447_05590 [Ruminococcaceae bacterium]|nr:hypothetical protein [Oscillospiraceae bacterium]